jgi:PAS domain S-box-containing protein
VTAEDTTRTNDTGELSADLAKRILDGAPDAVICADGTGAIRYWNSGAQDLFGFTAAEMVGQTMDAIVPENLRGRHWEGYERVVGRGEPSRYGRSELLKVPAMRSDGSRVSIEFTLQIIEEAGERLAVATLRDASAAFQEMRDLRRELAEAQAATRTET